MKLKKLFPVMLIAFFTLSNNVYAATGICNRKGFIKSFMIIGKIFNIVKIITPIILIVVGTVDLFKHVISNDDHMIQIAKKQMLNKALAAVLVFFVPTFVFGILDRTTKYKSSKDEVACALTCLSDTNACQSLLNSATQE